MKAWKIFKKSDGTLRLEYIAIRTAMSVVLILGAWIFFKLISSV